MDNSKAFDLATEIVDNIISKELTFTVTCNEVSEEGVYIRVYTERAQKIHDKIIKLLEEHG